MTLGQVLKQFRHSKGLTQEQFANLIGVSRDVLANWEVDRTNPTFEKLKVLAKFITPCVLLSQNNPNICGCQAKMDTGYCYSMEVRDE